MAATLADWYIAWPDYLPRARSVYWNTQGYASRISTNGLRITQVAVEIPVKAAAGATKIRITQLAVETPVKALIANSKIRITQLAVEVLVSNSLLIGGWDQPFSQPYHVRRRQDNQYHWPVFNTTAAGGTTGPIIWETT